MTHQKWSGFAFLVLPVALVVSSAVYFSGNLRYAYGAQMYDLADFLAGPVWAASLMVSFIGLREHFGDQAPRRMSLALLAASLAAVVMLSVALIRSVNRHFHLSHPDLHLEESTTVLVVWTTLVAGLSATGWHLMGWLLVLIGWSGWTTRRLPSVLNVVYLAGGAFGLFTYLVPEFEFLVMLAFLIVSLWQGSISLRAEPDAAPAA